MVRIGFTGDFCPINRVESIFIENKWRDAFKDAKSLLEGNDLNVLDLECPLTEADQGILKTGPHIKAKPQTVEILNWLKCELVATANNHFLDYGETGLKDTYDTLSRNNIKWIGSGINLKDARKGIIKTVKGLRIAFINMAENEWTTTNGEEAGCNPYNPVNVFNSIRNYREKADFIVVIMHGGHEHYELPSPRMKMEYRFLVDAGADAVIGHHPHVISGFEYYKDRPIFYSLGNFCIDWEGFRNHPWNIGMVVTLNLEKNKKPNHEIIVVRQNDSSPGVEIIVGDEKRSVLEHLEDLNKIISEDDVLVKRFNERCDLQHKMTLSRLQPYSNRYLAALNKRGLLPNLLIKDKRKLLTNLIRCESHREVLLTVLKDSLK